MSEEQEICLMAALKQICAALGAEFRPGEDKDIQTCEGLAFACGRMMGSRKYLQVLAKKAEAHLPLPGKADPAKGRGQGSVTGERTKKA